MLNPAAFFLNQAEASSQIHFVYNLKDQRVEYVNAAYERVLNGKQAQANDELPALLAHLPPDDLPWLRRCWQLWTQGRLSDEVEIRLLRPGKPDQWLCLMPGWQQDAEGTVRLGGSLRDITTSKRTQQTSLKFSTKKNTMLEILAHDLAGAFVSLQQLAGYIREEMTVQANPQVTEMLHLMQDTSQRGVQLIRDLVDQEFLESAAIPLKRERVDLREKVQQSLELFQRATGREAQQLRIELPSEPVYADVDVSKFMQVVNNLISNALKFTPDDGRIIVRVEAAPDGVLFVVADNGIGIPAALQPVLFERFTKARRPGLRGEPTTGLGLSLCQTIVSLHQGTLTVDSTVGEGTTFTVKLPKSTPAP
ncbi:HAMP domain-containing sensor histidine kinase [Hymenobacter sp. YC55]|uniref:PAS domain-containing sensor histidine kinase n=1 Tax=Hymenobacter sp. YC55 TaxID=3034019 RepID=UPI0023F68828|nr:HAMP domain-containing sensor histidine kinase [Hymenobacter sp. YC55]MDF7814836.1 HAMP domain-containing sensor histidine kinase [Hymenobacter sp. YC55]